MILHEFCVCSIIFIWGRWLYFFTQIQINLWEFFKRIFYSEFTIFFPLYLEWKTQNTIFYFSLIQLLRILITPIRIRNRQSYFTWRFKLVSNRISIFLSYIFKNIFKKIHFLKILKWKIKNFGSYFGIFSHENFQLSIKNGFILFINTIISLNVSLYVKIKLKFINFTNKFTNWREL